MKTPIIIVNFKCYEQATGKKAVDLAKICDSVSKDYNKSIGVSPQFCDIIPISKEVDIPVFAQHIDPIEPGSHTGHILPLSVKESGVMGTLINHSERKLPLEDIGKRVDIAKKYGLVTICCSGDLEESKKIANFDPDFIAYEPPELIGTGIPVSKTKPEVVNNTVKEVQKINPRSKVLCGAGITNGEDVKRAIELGTVGVLLASGVVKAKNPREILEDMVKSLS